MTLQVRPKTIARQMRFLTEFQRVPSVTLAAARTDTPRGTIYMWRQVDDEFRAAFDRIAAEHGRRRGLNRINRCPTDLPVLQSDLPIKSMAWTSSP